MIQFSLARRPDFERNLGPIVEMVHNSYDVEESIGTVAILLKRTGDITKNITIYCYTIQGKCSRVHSPHKLQTRRKLELQFSLKFKRKSAN